MENLQPKSLNGKYTQCTIWTDKQF